MSTADNDNITSPEIASASGSNSQDAGLSSAMHDMRSLAKSYMDHREQGSGAATPIALLSTAVDPRVLLLPTVEPRSDRLKIAMLSMMVLLGLSTSAIAVGLIMQRAPETKTQSYQDDPPMASTASINEIEIDASPATSSPLTDRTVYEVATSPETARATPERHELVVPPVTQPKRTKPVLRSRSGRENSAVEDATETCDEVACFLGDSDACCGTEPGDQERVLDEEERSERPYRLGRQQVMGPMKSISGRVRSCADQNGFEGVATATLIIAPDGSVKEVSLDEGSESFQSCVESKVQALTFPKLQQPFTTKYPYILR
jgi:hypothetical protein